MIFVTGATGFLGGAFVRACAARDTLRCLVRDAAHAIAGCETVNGTLADAELLKHALSGCSVVVHCAAAIAGPAELIRATNIMGTQNLVQAAVTNKVDRFVFISSAAIYKNQDEYAVSKQAAEKIVINSGLDYIILRPSEIYGAADQNGIIKLARLIGKFPVIPIIGAGKQTMQPVLIDDVVAILLQLCAGAVVSQRSYDVAGPRQITFNELIQIIEQVLEVRRLKIHIPIQALAALAGFLQAISKHPLLKKDQVQRIAASLPLLDIAPLVQDFGLQLHDLPAGLAKALAVG